MRTEEEKLATRLRKQEERAAHRERVLEKHPPNVRYAKAAFKKGKARQPKKHVKVKLGVQ